MCELCGTSINMDCPCGPCPGQPVYAKDIKDVPAWAKQHHEWPVATEVAKLKKLEVEVQMCCSVCEQKVREAVYGMCEVFEYTIDRPNNRLTVYECPSGGPDHKKLLKALKKAVGKKAKILEPKAEPEPNSPNPESCRCPSSVMVPWPPPCIVLCPPFITNPYYLHHPTVCYNCFMYPNVACDSCGRM
ncbi:uncharacterized protein [Physcomitrium patens]|uniref:HMA domain-containing protein n=1 Tax=Physcomitrium patens TaxID=3218 RepID=A0A2K1KCJ6_PHYPA|nr:uncharacterized protein LOC112284543 [Physcomitrium patens]PNR51503.1 hypothetical protein PHYPA_010690 [Physcomitrium patens]|eukprot:XP_024380195.1 uncharacterized protein LOC112284543 [Physcomitrella patens]